MDITCDMFRPIISRTIGTGLVEVENGYLGILPSNGKRKQATKLQILTKNNS